MFVRNLLQAGDYVTLIPVSMLITLQYSEKGTLQKVYRNHDSAAREELSNSVIAHMLKAKQVPNKISITGGTTWIEGVLYTDKFISDPGTLPECIFDSLLEYYECNPTDFEFYAGNVESLAQKFVGALSVRQWLTTSRFKLLPGQLVAGDLDESMFNVTLSRDYLFKHPLITNYIVFRGDQILHLSTGLSQCIVKERCRKVDESGYITEDVSVNAGDDVIVTRNVTCSDVVKFNLVPGVCIVSNSSGHIIYSESSGSKTDPAPDNICCSFCGKKLIIPKSSSAVFKCSDPQCNSVLYPRVKQLLEGFGLDVMSYSMYLEMSTEIGDIFSLPDIFDSDLYKDVEISIPLNKALRAILPKSILPGNIQISQLCDACNNSVDTVIYYIQHLDKMKTELGLDVHTFTRLFKWLLNPENASDVVELLRIPNLTIISSSCSFDGPPIFRDKLIAITGTFKHGSFADVKAILNSYAATVTTAYSADIDCVIVGDIEENMKGSLIREARQNGTPIFSESDFFTKYDIDSDMAENL